MPWYIHSIRRIYSYGAWAQTEGTVYARAVAEPYTAGRLFAAWAVLTGRAYAFEWPKLGDIEEALELPFWNRGTISRASRQAPYRADWMGVDSAIDNVEAANNKLGKTLGNA